MQIEIIKAVNTLYGRFEKGDIVTLSEQMCAMLIEQGFASIPSAKAAPAKQRASRKKKGAADD